MKYLALGDSYTIGEMVPFEKNFPNQVIHLLKEKNIDLELSDLIAKTGWTTDELSEAIFEKKPSHDHDWVTLLIGVNNQYRNRGVAEYAWQFYSLLCQAILFANGNAKKVIVLSIPDWGLTPFNKDNDKVHMSKEIDEYNATNKTISLELGVHYLDITPSTRLHAEDAHFLAEDLLHYSEHEYKIWATQVAAIINQ